ncbi:TetR/AcrR family transcriptional regulator [Ramlibacter sp. XY19]|uniref:TetR/AcrR family transcriptional regulator n=1 Tax=Ramlibacter paludis TaxID=2908000 RepID=UPI0023DBC29B|nr:TetR/AcrR family transcriptional regulator [Ramlibacter paludis]MCG2593281.1 TetR/AcrR family transcriptional regulator [Ramlibacter paludis]
MSEFAVLELAPGASQHRSRLLEGMAHAVAAKGYGETTIADIVREASVSRRTFYEHFSTKAECLVALYEAASRNALKVLRDAIDPARDWEAQVEHATAAYLGAMAANPVLMRTLFIEILHVGDEGLAARRRLNQEIADFIRARVAMPPELAMAVVGGIHELVLQAIEDGKVSELPQITGAAVALVKAVAHR